MNYEALIFDLDGTLYNQVLVHVVMATWMIVHYALRPLKIRELLVVLKYRKLRERLFGNASKDFNSLQIREAARTYGFFPSEAERVINLWMNQRPLKAVKLFRRRRLLKTMKKLKECGKIIIIYSDYPVKEKLEALGFVPDYAFWSTDGFIKCMKPDTRGLVKIIEKLKLKVNNVLYVGDRNDRDGVCAEKAGIDYLDVEDFVRKFC